MSPRKMWEESRFVSCWRRLWLATRPLRQGAWRRLIQRRGLALLGALLAPAVATNGALLLFFKRDLSPWGWGIRFFSFSFALLALMNPVDWGRLKEDSRFFRAGRGRRWRGTSL
ncbi:MAG: hypothetical protein HYZ90_05120 [Candidatus Omnitrophica bacterium]|nr:hypothetical protein [Candidatus Omnitrophota bacterium]